MTSAYPTGYDNVAADKTNSTPGIDDHPAHHDLLADAVNAIQHELGLDPSGGSATVAAAISAATAAAAAAIPGSALDDDSSFAANSTSRVPSQRAVAAALGLRLLASALDDDTGFAANSATKVPSQRAVKAAFAIRDAAMSVIPRINLPSDRNLALTDAGAHLELGATATRVITVPTETTLQFPEGSWVEFENYTASGTIQIAGGTTGMFLTPLSSSAVNFVMVTPQYGVCSIRKRNTGSNSWTVSGSHALS